MKIRFLKNLMLIVCSFAYSQHTLAFEYNVGPDQDLISLDEVPWLNLEAGDEVNIHYRDEPYRTKIGIHSRGTEQAPIIIRGISGPNGELPVISGENAKTPSNLNDFFKSWDESLGVILIKGGVNSGSNTSKAGYINIENLKIIGGRIDNFYTDSKGVRKNYGYATGGIWAKQVDNLTLRGTVLTDNSHGLFVLSNDGEENTSRNILIENNHIYNNGVSGSSLYHNIYTSASNIIIQNNDIGKLREGAQGASIKDRSSGTTIRNNRIESSAQAIDLVDPGEHASLLTTESDFSDTKVYGNLILNDLTDQNQTGSRIMFDYGGDTGQTDFYRKGTLHFHDNSIFINTAADDFWRVVLFNLTTDAEKALLNNNIFYHQGGAAIDFLYEYGTLSIQNDNFINDSNWTTSDESLDLEDGSWIIPGWRYGRPVGNNRLKGNVILGENGFFVGETLANLDISQFDPLLGNSPSFKGSIFDTTADPVPVPPAIWLMVSSFLSLGLMKRRKKDLG